MDNESHLYQVVWTKESLTFLVDGKKTFETTDPEAVPKGPHDVIAQVDGDSVDPEVVSGPAAEVTAVKIEFMQINYGAVGPLPNVEQSAGLSR